MGIADVFEALTASDRPYKSAKTLSESIQILGRMKVDQHIDPDLFDVFLRERVYLSYARQFLDPKQIDRIDWHQVPGVSVELAVELSATEAKA
jgi:HD-GYP domain-containing protein (c-di-GMP phosphodiesterase class II)